jgi:hypothetical protein
MRSRAAVVFARINLILTALWVAVWALLILGPRPFRPGGPAAIHLLQSTLSWAYLLLTVPLAVLTLIWGRGGPRLVRTAWVLLALWIVSTCRFLWF